MVCQPVFSVTQVQQEQESCILGVRMHPIFVNFSVQINFHKSIFRNFSYVYLSTQPIFTYSPILDFHHSKISYQLLFSIKYPPGCTTQPAQNRQTPIEWNILPSYSVLVFVDFLVQINALGSCGPGPGGHVDCWTFCVSNFCVLDAIRPVQISDCVDFASWIAEHFLTRCVYQSANGSAACSGRSQAEDWGS